MDSIYYRGQVYPIKLVPYPGKTAQIIFRDQMFHMYLSNKVKETGVRREAAVQLKNWMLAKADEVIKFRTAEWSRIIGVEFNSIRIKDTKTRWGSCSSKKNLNFNFRIVMAPQEVMDYIIIHELCHLKQMNHGKEFWSMVQHYMPDYENSKKWLKENGGRLYLI